MTPRKTVDILVVGGGASGLTASMLLSKAGISTWLVSKYPTTSRLPKASGLAVKTMELFRELGIEDDIRARATPTRHLRYTGLYAGFAGSDPDYGRPIVRLGYWDTNGEDPDWHAVSTVRPANLMQSQLEPVMRARAEELAPNSIFFNHSFIDLDQRPDGILATLEDRATGERYTIKARYMLACDGGRVVGPRLGVAMEGQTGLATSVSVHFSADLSPWIKDEECLLTTVVNPDFGVPCALVKMGPKEWGPKSEEWVAHMLSFVGDHQAYDDAGAVARMRQLLGLPDVPVTVHLINRWPLDAVVAKRFRVGNVFLLGDAAHRMPPAGGHGLNTAVQDAYNLCWKLAAVLRGDADPELLDSYDSERRPVAQHNVALALKGWQNNKALAEAIGIGPHRTAAENWAAVREIWAPGAAGAPARRRVAAASPALAQNANPLHPAYGYTYHDGAVLTEGAAVRFQPGALDAFTPSTRPGHSVPDRWVNSLTERTTIGDLVGRGRFVLIAGEAGNDWVEAARHLARRLGLPLDAVSIGGADADWLDSRGSWQRVREIGPDGALLVRPDRFIAWRSLGRSSRPSSDLEGVFAHLLKGDLRRAA